MDKGDATRALKLFHDDNNDSKVFAKAQRDELVNAITQRFNQGDSGYECVVDHESKIQTLPAPENYLPEYLWTHFMDSTVGLDIKVESFVKFALRME